MGVAGLIAFLRKRAPGAFAPFAEEQLRGSAVGVDLSVVLCRGLAVAYDAGEHYYLELLAKQVAWLRDLGCRPVYVADGESPVEKAEEKQRRERVRAELERRLEDARRRCDAEPDSADAQEALVRLERQRFVCGPRQRLAAERLLRGLGVCLVQAEGEAERTLAHLQRAGRVDHIFTEDVDALLCGASSYVKDAGSLQWATPAAVLVSLEGTLAGLGVGYRGLVALGMLSGCDFAPKLPGLGPATAFKLVKAHGESLEACLRAVPRKAVFVGDEVVERYLRAERLLLFDPAFPLPELVDGAFDAAGLESLCVELGAVALRRALQRRGPDQAQGHEQAAPVQAQGQYSSGAALPETPQDAGGACGQLLGGPLGDAVERLAPEALGHLEGRCRLGSEDAGAEVAGVEAQREGQHPVAEGRKRRRSPSPPVLLRAEDGPEERDGEGAAGEFQLQQ
jgi:hypothetical protein